MRTPLALLQQVRFECVAEMLCPRCQSVMERHQPDPDEPDRLLGTCAECGVWTLIDLRAGVMYALPDVWDGPDDH